MKSGWRSCNPGTTTAGGRAPWALRWGIRLDIRRIQAIKNGDEVVGGRSKVKGCKE